DMDLAPMGEHDLLGDVKAQAEAMRACLWGTPRERLEQRWDQIGWHGWALIHHAQLDDLSVAIERYAHRPFRITVLQRVTDEVREDFVDPCWVQLCQQVSVHLKLDRAVWRRYAHLVDHLPCQSGEVGFNPLDRQPAAGLHSCEIE